MYEDNEGNYYYTGMFAQQGLHISTVLVYVAMAYKEGRIDLLRQHMKSFGYDQAIIDASMAEITTQFKEGIPPRKKCEE